MSQLAIGVPTGTRDVAGRLPETATKRYRQQREHEGQEDLKDQKERDAE
jgi:hypothetical protein